VKRMLEIIERIDRVPPRDMELKPEVIPIKYAEAADIASVIGSLSPSGVGATIGQSSGRSSSGGSNGRTNRSTGGANSLNSSNQRNSSTGSRTTGGSTGSFQNRLNQIVSRASGGAGGELQILGEVNIMPDQRTNSILVFANEKDMIMIKDIISKIDTVLAQVLIESIILEVSLNDSFSLGVSMLQQERKSGKFKGTGGSANGGGINSFLGDSVAPEAFSAGFSYFGSWGDDIDIAVQALSAQGEVELVSRPRIQTSHAVTGSFFVGDTVPYITGTGSSGGFGGGFGGGFRSQYQQLEVGIRLDVTPLINSEGLVVMEIDQTIDALGAPVTIDGNEVPTTTSRTATATVAVRDGETIMLGGFVKADNQKGSSGVPVLKDIPFLGNLFRSKSDSNQRTEMIVLMRPTVLPTPQSAAITATHERNLLTGIRQLEEDRSKGTGKAEKKSK
jgi:general secretion pathway protein D